MSTMFRNSYYGRVQGHKRRRYSTKKGKSAKRGFRRYGAFTSTKAISRYLKPKGTVWVNSNSGAYPESCIVTLPYVETVQVTTTSGVGGFYVFSGNSLFDPNITGTGHQPFAFDTWSELFGRYCVYGSAIEVQVTPQATASVDNYTVKYCVNPFTFTTGLSSVGVDAQSEFPHAKSKYCTVYQQNSSDNLKHYMSTAKVFGVSNNIVESDDLYSGTTSSSPSNQWGWWITLNDSLENGSFSYWIRVKIRYYAKMYKPGLQTQS